VALWKVPEKRRKDRERLSCDLAVMLARFSPPHQAAGEMHEPSAGVTVERLPPAPPEGFAPRRDGRIRPQVMAEDARLDRDRRHGARATSPKRIKNKPRLAPLSRIRLAVHSDDLFQNVAGKVGFGDEMPVVRDLCRRWLSAARCNQQENVRPLLVYPPGKLDPVKFPRHLNIGKEDTYVGCSAIASSAASALGTSITLYPAAASKSAA
jgi:hypothetical protein